MGDLADYINSSPLTIKTYISNLNALILNICLTFVYIILLIQVSFGFFYTTIYNFFIE